MSGKSFKLFVISLVFGAVVFLPAFSHAAIGGDRTCPVKDIFYNFFNITEQQQEELKQVKSETYEEIKPFIEEMKVLGEQIPEMLLADNIDTAAASDLIEQMIDPESPMPQMMAIQFNSMVSAAQVLTPEQRADIQEVVKDITDFIDYIMAYPKLDDLKDKYGDRLMRSVIGRKLKFIDLTDEQITEIIDLMKEIHETIDPIAEELELLEDQLQAALLAENIDTATVAEVSDLMIDLQLQLMSIGLNSQVTAAQILTSEQRSIIKQKMEEIEEHHDSYDHS
jgi:Spy/CpxP family protein refolding chaperone